MPHACPSFRLGLVLSLLLGLLVGITTPVQAADGDLFSWGSNQFGQLGDGTKDDRRLPESVTPDFPAEVVAVAAGGYHSLALLDDGTVWAWGRNSQGELGNGDAGDSYTPTQVPGLPAITAISAGGYHSMALDEDGTIWTWGYNSNGQLGNGSFVSAESPIQLPTLTDVVDIAAGYFHTLALTENGTVFAWGFNDRGQLGIGSGPDQPTPTVVAFPNDPEIVNVASGAGSHNSLAIAADGTLYQWGRDLAGSVHRYAPVMVEGISDVVDASAGIHHVQALTANGAVYGWGQNVYSGTDTPEISDTPRWVMDDAVTVVAGGYHGLAIDSTGALWSWGGNADGQLGTGTSDYASSPVLVETSLTFRAVAGGWFYTLAIEGLPDITPPITTATVNGLAPEDGWYQSATMTLIADEPATTTYEVGAGPTQTYTDPFMLSDGEHTITYRSTDLAGNVEDDQTLTVKVDSTNPTIQPIPGQTLDQLTPTGTTVTFTTDVGDNFTPTDDLVVACVDQHLQPFASGQTAPVATTIITCTVTDLAGNTSSTDFVVTVVADLDPPALAVETTSGGEPYLPGTWTTQPVTVVFTCTDAVVLGPGIAETTSTTVDTEGANQQVASPACQDGAGNTATPQTVTGINIDWTDPTIQPIPSQTLEPISPAGAPVVFTPNVADNVTQAHELVVTCVDQFSNPFTSGQFAPIGLTTMTCTVTDLAGKTTSTAFTVTVSGVGEQLVELRAMISSLPIDSTVKQTLLTQVAIIEAMVNAGQSGMACVQLTNLDLQIKAQESKRRIDRRDAAAIYAQTQQIRNVIGCGGSTS